MRDPQRNPRVIISLFLALALSFLPAAAATPIQVVTNRYDNARSGATLNETILNTSNVDVKTFGKLFSRQVVGDIYAQPLYVSTVSIPGKGTHNVIFVETSDNNVYAFDADDPNQATPLWEVNLGPYFTRNLDTNDVWDGRDGVLGTPVIDPASGAMYVVSHHDVGTKQAKFTLHALDITTGQEKTALGSPIDIQASVPSKACSNNGGSISLDGPQHLQRPGLLLLAGNLFIGFGSSGVSWPWHGWIVAYDVKNLRQSKAVFNSSPGNCNIVKPPTGVDVCKSNFVPPQPASGYGASFWQSGDGLASDGTSIFGVTGNGSFNAYAGGKDYGDSMIKFSPSLLVQDYFTPYNQLCMDLQDLDLGITGTLVVPGENMLITGGKLGKLYLVDSRKMGHFHSNLFDDSQIVQSLDIGKGAMFGLPVFWNGPNGPVLFTWNEYDNLKAWTFTPFQDGLATLNATPSSVSAFTAFGGSPGGIMTLSANGNTAGTGIIWGVQVTSDKTHAAILRAWDATDLTKELWDSDMAPNSRDSVGKIAKFDPPTVANGKVYIGTFSNMLDVYGILPS